jgi:hypothetical protein
MQKTRRSRADPEMDFRLVFSSRSICLGRVLVSLGPVTLEIAVSLEGDGEIPRFSTSPYP